MSGATKWRIAACVAAVTLVGVLVAREPSTATAGATDAAVSSPAGVVPPPVQAPPPWQPFQAQALKVAGLELADTPLELAFACSWTFGGRASHTSHDDE